MRDFSPAQAFNYLPASWVGTPYFHRSQLPYTTKPPQGFSFFFFLLLLHFFSLSFFPFFNLLIHRRFILYSPHPPCPIPNPRTNSNAFSISGNNLDINGARDFLPARSIFFKRAELVLASCQLDRIRQSTFHRSISIYDITLLMSPLAPSGIFLSFFLSFLFPYFLSFKLIHLN